jgi:transcriptional regulator with XRE-family HTH domain
MKIEETLKKIGLNIKKHRLKLGLTQEALGEKCGLDSRHIGFIERGQLNSTVKTLLKIAHGLGLPIKSLFSEV